MKRPVHQAARYAALSLGLLASPLATTTATAQAPPPGPEGEGDKSGRPLDGYLGTLMLIMLAFFIIGKSARR